MSADDFALRASWVAVGGAAAVLGVLGQAAQAADGVYTSIQRADCTAPPPDIASDFVERDLGVQECPAPDDWHLLFVASNANSWLELRRGKLAWSTEDALVYQRPIGMFANVGGSPVVEWRRDAQGRLKALIFRVVAQDSTDPVKRVSRLFVVRLDPDGPCVLGRVTTNQAARALADDPTACPGPG